MREFAKQLRRRATEAERRLWYHLRARRLHGYKFCRQLPLDRYVVDFVCRARKLIVEIDGSQHAANADYDSRRTAALERAGFRVVRYWNHDVLFRTDEVLADLLRELERGGEQDP